MTTYSNVTLLLQGPLIDNRFLKNTKINLEFQNQLAYYKTLFDHIILSTYSEHVTALPQIQSYCDQNKIMLVHKSLDAGWRWPTTGTMWYQTYTILNGLEHVSTSYVLKHRVDESYNNLHLVLDRFLQDTRKWVCGSMSIGPKIYRLYHPSDHLFITTTELMRQTMQLTWDNLQKHTAENNNSGLKPDTDPNSYGPEITYAKNFLRCHGEVPTDDNHDQLMLQYFDFINDQHLWPFVLRNNHARKYFTTIEELGPNRLQYQTINDLLTLKYAPGHENYNYPNLI